MKLKRWLLIPRRSLEIGWDREYGCDKKSGWTIFVDGSCLVQFERWLLVALIKTWWHHAMLWEDDSL